MFQAALCCAYVRIVKVCPPHIWKPDSLISILCSPKPYYGLVECFEVALSTLNPDLTEKTTYREDYSDTTLSTTSGHEPIRVGEKRPIHFPNVLSFKRKKLDESKNFKCDPQNLNNVYNQSLEGKKESAEYIWSSLVSFIKCLEPPAGKANVLEREISLTALSMLCIVLCKYPRPKLSCQISRQMLEWIPWIWEQVLFLVMYKTCFCPDLSEGYFLQANKENLAGLDLSIYFEALHGLLLKQSKGSSFLVLKV